MYRAPGAEPPPDVSVPSEIRTGAGAAVTVTVVVTNRAPEPRIMSVTAMGVDAAWLPHPTRSHPVLPGESVAGDLVLAPSVGTLPARYPLAIAVQALDPVHEQATAPTALASVDLIVDAPGQLALTLSPTDTTGVFGRRFRVVVENTGATDARVLFETRSAQGARLDLKSDRLELPAGQSAAVVGRVRPRRVRMFGQRARHSFSVTARSSGAPRTVQGSLTARAMFGPSATKAAVLLAVVAVWVALAIVFIPKLAQSEKNKQATANGPVQTTGQSGTGGSGGAGGGNSGGTGSGSGGGGASPGGSPGAASGSHAAKTLQLNGTVAGNAPSGVTVSVSPTSLVDEQADTATPVGISPAAFGKPGKLAGESITATPLTGDRSTQTSADGAWSVPGLREPGYYLVTFSKPGYATQRYIVDSTAAVATQPLVVTLVPGDGALSGHVTGPKGAVGGAQITITDGTDSVTTTSDSTGEVGAWTVHGLSTPGDYLVSAGSTTLGTESQLVHLDAGGSGVVDLTLRAGVTSIVGNVHDSHGTGLGGITVSATNGAVTRTATTVTTDALRGDYTLSDLPAPGDYTVTFSGTGYLSQTVTAAAAKGHSSVTVDVAMFPSAAAVVGTVTGDQLDDSGAVVGSHALVGAGLILTSPDETYKTTTDDSGTYRFDGVAPGDYVLSAQFGGLTTMFKSVTVPPGVTRDIAVPAFDLTKPAAPVNTAQIVGYAGDGTTPGNTLCPNTPTECTLSFTLTGSDGTTHPVTPENQPTTAPGPTRYVISSPDNLAPGLYQLAITVLDKDGNLKYLAETIGVEVPLGGVATAPQVALFPSNTVQGAVQVSGDLIHDGPGAQPENCVYAVPDPQPAPANLSVCDKTQLQPSTCNTTGKAGPAYTTITAQNDYTLDGLCDGSYTIYYVITNPWYINSVPSAHVTVGRNQPIATLNIQVSSYGRMSMTLGQTNATTGTIDPLPPDTSVTVACTDGTHSSTSTIRSDGTTTTATVIGGLTQAEWVCTGTASGFTAATTGVVAISNGKTQTVQLVFTQSLGAFVGRVTTAWSGSQSGVSGGVVTITGVTSFLNGQAQTTHVSVTPDTRGCFAITSDATLPDGYSAPGACADDPDLASATKQFTLTSAQASFTYAPPAGYRVPAELDNQTLDGHTLTTIAVQPNPVDLAGGSLTTSPAPDGSAAQPFAGFAVAVTQAAPGAGQVSVSVDPVTGALSWQDSNLAANQIAPGTYRLQVGKANFLTKTVSITCLPGVPCDLGTITVVQLGALAVTTSAGGTDVPDAIVSVLNANGDVTQTLRPTPGTATVDFPGLTPAATYNLHVQAAGYQFGDTNGPSPLVTLSCDQGTDPTTVEIAPGATTHCTATLTRDGAITGTVHGLLALPSDPSPPRQTLAGVPVTATACGTHTAVGSDTNTYCTGTTSTSFQTSTAADGTFRVTGTSTAQGLEPGYWLVTVTAPGYAPPAVAAGAPSGALAGLVVHVTQATSDTDASPDLFVVPARFVVTVKDQNGAVVNGLGDSAVSLIAAGATVASAHEVVDSHGASTYQFDAVVPGPYTLEIAASGYLTSDQQVQIVLGVPTQSYTAPVVAGASRVTASVTGVQGTSAVSAPLAGATACLIPATAGTGSCASKAAKGTDGAAMIATTGAAGTVVFPAVPDGSYVLQGERYGYVTGASAAVVFKHTLPPPPATVDLTRVTRTVVVTVTATDRTDNLTASSGGTLTSPPGASPANTTLSNLAKDTSGGPRAVAFSQAQVPYGCWTFSFTAPANHFGELSGPSPASSASDGTLTCGAGQFLVPGTAGGAVDLDYSFAEYQPTLTITVSKASSDPDPTLTVTAAKQGDSSTTYQPGAVAIGTATSLGFWVAPDVNVDLSVSTGATSTWPTGGSATVSSAAPDATINLVEYTPVVVTVQDALGPVSGAAVTFTSATGALNIGPNSTDAQGHLSISIPYERDWVAHATTSGGESGQSTQFSTSAGETDVSISVH